MPQVHFTRHLLRFFPDLAAGEVPGETVREIVEELNRRFPGIAGYLVDEAGALRKHVNIFVGGAGIRDREGLSDPVQPDTEIFVMQALSGG